MPRRVPCVWADRGAVVQVLLNLLKNALYSLAETTEGLREVHISLKCPCSGEVMLSVWDTGDGIPEHVLPNLFSAFFTTKVAGTGIGLSICWALMSYMGAQ